MKDSPPVIEFLTKDGSSGGPAIVISLDERRRVHPETVDKRALSAGSVQIIVWNELHTMVSWARTRCPISLENDDDDVALSSVEE